MAKDAPDPPDYKAAAEATAESNEAALTSQTWANRPNVSTPWGSQTWSAGKGVDPATGKEITTWNSNISLTPAQQQALDSQQNIQQGRSDAAGKLLGQATSAFDQQLDWNSLPGRADQIQAPNLVGQVTPTMGQMNSGIDPTSTSVSTVNPFSFGPVNRSVADAGDIQTGLNGSSGDYRQRAQDAVWNLQKPMLDERRAGVETQLANMGLARGSEAWEREMRSVDDAEARAQLAAISEGRNESSMAFGQDLQSGQFANNAQQQQFGQNLQEAGFGNTAQAQEFDQGVRAVGVNNQAQAQEFGQNTTEAGFENQVTQQRFDAAMRSAQMGDTRALQQLQAEISAGGFNNQNRSAALAEAIQRRGQPLNELNALLTGQQVNMPNMPNTPMAGRAPGVDYTGAADAQYGAAMQGANFQQGQINSFLGAAASLGGAYMFSDRRLKHRIRTVGVLSSGVRVVHYEYVGLPGAQIGVIAQELQQVQPEAVSMHPSGYLMVDYSQVHA